MSSKKFCSDWRGKEGKKTREEEGRIGKEEDKWRKKDGRKKG